MLNKKYNVNSLMLGKAGEYRVAAELVLRGHMIYLPGIDNGVDIIIDDGIRIQIKCGQRHMASKYQKHKNITYNFNVRSCKYSRYSHKILEPHPLEGVDFVICWAIDDGEFYIIPADKVRGQTTIKITADMDRRTKVKWNQWLPYRNAWEQLDGIPIKNIKKKTELECVNCGYKWLPLTEHPSRCPNCNKHWDVKMYDHVCKRCGNEWHSNIVVINGNR